MGGRWGQQEMQGAKLPLLGPHLGLLLSPLPVPHCGRGQDGFPMVLPRTSPGSQSLLRRGGSPPSSPPPHLLSLRGSMLLGQAVSLHRGARLPQQGLAAEAGVSQLCWWGRGACQGLGRDFSLRRSQPLRQRLGGVSQASWW